MSTLQLSVCPVDFLERPPPNNIGKICVPGSVRHLLFRSELVSAGVDPALISNPDYVKAAPILPNVEMFDASFFGYSPKDAALMDPQQRCSWRFPGRRSKTPVMIQLATREKSAFFPAEEASSQAI